LYIHIFTLVPPYQITSLLLIALSHQDCDHLEAIFAMVTWFGACYSPARFSLADPLFRWIRINERENFTSETPSDFFSDPRLRVLEDRSPDLFSYLTTKWHSPYFVFKGYLQTDDGFELAQLEVHQRHDREVPWIYCFDGIPLTRVSISFVAFAGRLNARGVRRLSEKGENMADGEPLTTELAWVIASEHGVLTLFMFFGKNNGFSVARVSDGAISYENWADEDYEFDQARVYVACWGEATLLPGSIYQLSRSSHWPPLATSLQDLPRQVMEARDKEVWKKKGLCLERVICESIQFPAYFLTGCGFTAEIALSVMIAFGSGNRVNGGLLNSTLIPTFACFVAGQPGMSIRELAFRKQ
jgi:hypothetical protein